MDSTVVSQEDSAVTQCLAGIQQMLVSAKWHYVQTTDAPWPLAFVHMTKENSLLLIGPFGGPQSDALVNSWLGANKPGYSGVLLVGTVQTDDPAVDKVFEASDGSIAYLDAARGQHRLRRKWTLNSDTLAPLSKHNLKRFLNPVERGYVDHIDCQAAIAKDIQDLRESAAFREQAAMAKGSARFKLTSFLIAACVAVFAGMVATGGTSALSNPSIKLLIAWGAEYGPLIRSGQFWRMITSAFVHIGIIHLGFNMMAMYYFGRPLESMQGRWRLGAYYVFAILTGSLASLWWHPTIVGAGASGGLFGLVGAMAALTIRYWKDFPPAIRQGLKRWLFTVLGYNAIFLVMPFIDGAAHIGGFFGGLAIALVLSRSPVRNSKPGTWAWFVFAAMIIGVLAIATYVVLRIPVS